MEITTAKQNNTFKKLLSRITLLIFMCRLLFLIEVVVVVVVLWLAARSEEDALSRAGLGVDSTTDVMVEELRSDEEPINSHARMDFDKVVKCLTFNDGKALKRAHKMMEFMTNTCEKSTNNFDT